MLNFTLLGGYLGIYGPKNTQICQKISNVANFFAPQGRIPRPISVKFMCYMCLTCLRNVLKFGAIWFINDKSVGTKLRWVIFPENFRSPYLWNYWSDTKSKGGPKNGTDMLYPHAKFGGDLPQHSGERGKMGVFCLFVFVCLSHLRSMYLCTIGALTVRVILLPFISRFWCSFQRFLEEEMPCRIFQKYLNYITRWRYIYLGIRS